MSLSSEFKQSLKTVDSEEILDLIIFRPISFVFVKLIYNTNITPNHISTVALMFGILTGVLYGYGTRLSFILASVYCVYILLAKSDKIRKIPFAPFISLATVLIILTNFDILNFWFDIISN